MKKTMEINGRVFEVGKKGEKPSFDPRWSYTDISSAYERPSSTKVEIWNDWLEWERATGATIWISGKNNNFFSISGYIEIKNKLYGLRITYAHNRIWEVE